ncbi:MAG: RHS repeat-associated core domain-containing protein [Spirochaetota bacterium]
MKSVTDSLNSIGVTAKTTFAYDASGTRVAKSGNLGDVVYVNANYTLRNSDLISKHVFAGNTRIVSKIVTLQTTNGQTVSKDMGSYYYHGDHLGSSSVITDSTGKFYEHIEYFPYGEDWIDDKASTTAESVAYKFTGKEYDAETGYTNFGARYYDMKLCTWISVDKAFPKYMPSASDFDTEHDYYWYLSQDSSNKLPGIGGVFNSANLNVYSYATNNPVKFTDPDGNWVINIPFTGVAFYVQQKPKCDGGGYRAGFASESSGRHIDPTGTTGFGSLFSDQKISFINDDPSKGTTDKPVSSKQAAATENVADKTGLLFNVNSSKRGPGNEKHSTGDAVDINRVADKGDVGQFKGSTPDSKSAVAKMNKDGNKSLIDKLSKAFGAEGAQEVLDYKNRPQDHSNHVHAGDVVIKKDKK